MTVQFDGTILRQNLMKTILRQNLMETILWLNLMETILWLNLCPGGVVHYFSYPLVPYDGTI